MRAFYWIRASPGLLSAPIFGVFAPVVYTKRGCFANRFLRKSKADFREAGGISTGRNNEKRQGFDVLYAFDLVLVAIFETALTLLLVAAV